MKRLFLIIGVLGLVLGLAAGLRYTVLSAPTPKNLSQEPGVKPIDNWYVCEDLGIGPVPGLPDERQRLRLCHTDGWEVLAYCVQPNLPVPEIGTVCTRTGETEYSCGPGFQRLREYVILATPAPQVTSTSTGTPTSVETATPTPSATFTQTPGSTAAPSATNTPVTPVVSAGTSTPIPGPRQLPGGVNYLGWLARSFRSLNPAGGATPTPFQPLPVTPTIHPPTPVPPSPSYQFDALDFSRQDERIRIHIQPPDRQVNGGRPIIVKFFPGEACPYGDRRACITSYFAPGGSEVIWISAHSGVGAQGQAFRHAVEGTSLFGAALRLPQVQANLQALAGAQVILTQGDKVLEGYRLVAVGRVPGAQLSNYTRLPVSAALEAAAESNPALSSYLSPDHPMLVFETCGWNLPGEALTPGVSSASASVYLGIIQKIP